MTTDGDAVLGSTSQHLVDEQQRLLIAQFVRATFTMRQVDELFLWITSLMVQRFRIQAAQVWANCQTQQGFSLPELRSSTRKEQFLPEALLSNPEITAVAGNILRAGRAFLPAPVDQSFSSPFAQTLHRYTLNYSLGFFLGHPTVFLPPPTNAVEQISAPLAITLLLFVSQVPSQHELVTMNDIFQKILPVARSRRLLLTTPTVVTPQAAQQNLVPDLFDLIPHRYEDPADNPLALSIIMKDGATRRFYGAMNGRRSVRELCVLAGLERAETTVIVQKLLAVARIKLYQSDGQVVESSSLFGNY